MKFPSLIPKDLSPLVPSLHQWRTLDAATGIKNLQNLIDLRWMAVVGQVLTILVVHYGLKLVIPTQEMLLIVACLALFNVVSLVRLRSGHRAHSVEIFLALLIDVAVLTGQLYLSGGISNPFVFLYLLQIALGAVLLPGAYIWSMVFITVLCLELLSQYHLPLALPQEGHEGLPSLYVLGLLLCFILNATLVVIFITRIHHNLRERDARLAKARRRRLEEEHIVRMGLLASGAAHELGTPLSTLAVILGDWQHDPHLSSQPLLREDIAEMQIQVQRCKSIVSSILLSAGETRGEASQQTTVCRFVDALAQEWHATRSMPVFDYHNDFGNDTPMVSDTTLQQMVFNVLDNARDASPDWVGLRITRDGEDFLCFTITDQGPGFLPEMLAQLGKPYQSTKQREGSGLGLYLVLNVARTLGGNVTASNRSQGGAIVTIRLPLSSIALAPPAL